MRSTVDKINRTVKNNSVISFDLFDTLVTRIYADPKDVFFEIEKLLFQKDIKCENFAEKRIEAELSARKKHNFTKEVKLKEIYNYLSKNLNLTPSEKDSIYQMELEQEKKAIVPLYRMVGLLKRIRNDIDQLLLISDIYFPQDFIISILKNIKIDHLFDALYISSELGYQKSTGDMFTHIMKTQNISPNDWAHIGDNIESDYKTSKEYGIEAIHFSEVKLNRYENYNINNFNSNLSKYIATMKRARLEGLDLSQEDKIIWDTSVNVAGPLIFSFVSWCLQYAKNNNIYRLYFMARDGQIMYNIAKIIVNRLEMNISIKYIYVSRQALLLPSIEEINEENLEWILAPTTYVTPRIILRRIDIKPEEIKAELKKHGYDNFDKHIEHKELHKFREIFREKRVKKLVFQRVKHNRDALWGYLKQNGLTEPINYALIDIGWSGTLQRSISKILDIKGYNKPVTGLYFGLRRRLKYKNSDILEGFFTTPEKKSSVTKKTYIVPMLELFTAADHGGTRKYIKKSDYYKPVLKNKKNLNALKWGLKIQHNAMHKFTNMLMECKFEKIPDIIQNRIDKNFTNFILNPSYAEAKKYGHFLDAEDQNESYYLPLAKKYNFIEAFKHFRFGYLHHHNEWKEGAEALTFPLLKKMFNPN